MNDFEIAGLLARQAGVVSRRQVLSCEGDDNDIARLLRRREWATVHPGVYVDHTGPLTWDQRAWAAVLRHAPAALSGRSAMRAHRMRMSPAVAPDTEPIEIVIADDRHVGPAAGVRVRRTRHFQQMCQTDREPPRMRLEHAVVLVAGSAAGEDAAVAVLADACQSRRTTPARLAAALADFPRLELRRLALTILDDVASGAYSALERRYLTRVERPHGFPTGRRQRQVRAGRRKAFRDVDYLGLATVVELDGRLGHEEAADRWADLDRDLAALESGDVTLRIGWGQVLDPCRLAAAVARILIARGWSGPPKGCSANCPVGDLGGSPASFAGKSPRSAPDARGPDPACRTGLDV